MERLTLNLVPAGVMPEAHASQFDNGRVIRFNIRNGEESYTLTGAETITAEIAKPDGSREVISIPNTSSNYVDLTTEEDTCSVPGLYGCEIKITDGAEIIGSQNFILKVEVDPYADENVHVETVGPADICTFETTLPEPLQSVLVNVEATGGNGTPDNPIPINGYSSANITRCGVNLYSDKFSDYTKPVNYYIKKVPLKQGATYTLKAILKGTAITGCVVGIAQDNDSYPFVGQYTLIKTDGTILTIAPITIGNNWVNPKLIVYCSGESQFNDLFENYEILLVEGTDTTYHPYTGNTYTVNFGQTVYGGVLDVTRGKLKPCIEYPSYNGETLSGRWLSSEATYVEGTTPPIGSQVVSLDDYGTDIDLTPEVISAVVGTNNVFAGCGETTVKYLKAGG